MPYRNTNLSIDGYYHLYNRGNSKQIIFKDDKDCEFFQKLLKILNTDKRKALRNITESIQNHDDEKIVSIGAYCLMPNHFHILIKQEVDGGISLFMKKILTAYVMYFNKKYSRSGGLFEGRFKSKHINNDNYLKYLFAYIHLNPIKIKDSTWNKNEDYKRQDNIDFIKNYKYSSFIDYLNIKREENYILNKSAFPEYFPNKEEVLKYLNLWIDIKHNN